MKNGIVNVWLWGLIIVFIGFFSAYIIITLEYSRSFKIKNEVLTIIEKNKGVTRTDKRNRSGVSKISTGATITTNVNTIQTINLYLLGSGYTAKGQCPLDEYGGIWYGVKDLGKYNDPANDIVKITSSTVKDKYYYCFSKYNANLKGGMYKAVYYRVVLFYKFEVPALSEFLSVRVDGLTDEVYDPQDESQIEESTAKVYKKIP